MRPGGSVPDYRLARILSLAILLFFAVRPATQAMVINITYDSDITTLPNAAQVEGAINLAAHVLQTLYTNSITVNLYVMFTNNIDLGASSTAFTGNPTYSEITNYLRATRTTAADSNSVASLPASDPTGGGTWWIAYGEAKAFAAATGSPVLSVGANDPTQDGIVYFASTNTYALNPTNRAVTGQFDLTAVAEHEFSEVLGRGSGLGFNLGGGYTSYDLFRYTNSGAHNFDVFATNAYFSIDKGATRLSLFYTDFADTGGDPQDWDTHIPADSYDAFLSDGQEGYLSYADLIALDVLGYNLNFHPPKLQAARTVAGKMQLTFTNVTGLNFSIIASTNLSTALTNWVNLGTPIETSVGNYQFIDSATNKTRYYRARLN